MQTVKDNVPRRAILVGIRLPENSESECRDSLSELERLVHTLGHEVVGTLVQPRPSLNGPTVVGEGKLEELAQWTGGTGEVPSPVKRKTSKAARRASLEEDDDDQEDDAPVEARGERRAQVVIFDCDLSPSQMHKVQQAVGAPVLDRSGVIIEIFSRHARSRAARLQVEIARLNYMAPRLRETGGGGDRQGGGIGGKGAGETTLELDRRRIRDRVKALKEELDSVADEEARRRERRSETRTVALVGYTNAGKSSMMRALTGSEVLVADQLFATLDTTVRPVHPEVHPRILVSDTVGFIKKLPHDLVASFRSTLDEAKNAALLLHLVDASDPGFRSQLEVTRTVLAEVGAGDVSRRLVLNKIDRVTDEGRAALSHEFPDALQVSALNPADVAALRTAMIAFFEAGMIDQDLFVPYQSQALVARIRSAVRVVSESYDAQGVCLLVRAKPADVDRLKVQLGL